MKLARDFSELGLDEIKKLFDGGTLEIYSVARPSSPEAPVTRSGLLASFTFASPAFGEVSDGYETPNFVANPVPANNVGTPGFARARKADGAVIADFSAGPGNREIKFSEVSCTQGAPVTLTRLKFMPEGGWPEKPEYYETRPRSGFPLPKNP